MKRSINIRVTEEEYEKILNDAMQSGHNLTNHIRVRCNLSPSKYRLGSRTLKKAQKGTRAKIMGRSVEITN